MTSLVANGANKEDFSLIRNGTPLSIPSEASKDGSSSGANSDKAARLCLLGRPKLLLGKQDLTRQIKYRKGIALLGYLATRKGSWCSRETLADLLWPGFDSSVARTNLRQVLNNLGSVLRPLSEGEILKKDIAAVVFDTDDQENRLQLDVELLSDAVFQRIKHNSPDNRLWRQREIEPRALSIDGEFLDGLQLPDTPEFDEWLQAKRTHFRERSARLLEYLCHAQHAEGRLEEAVASARRLANLAPFDENRVLLLMSMLAESGDSPGALAFFDDYRQRLADEMNATPHMKLIHMRRRLLRRLEVNAVSSQLRESAPPEMRHIAALYCAYGTEEAEEDFAEQVEPIVRTRGGMLISASGRGMLSVFGLGKSTERATQRALLAARDLQITMSDHRGFTPCIGVSAGRILLRVSSDIPHLAGEIPDLAKLIGWSAQPGEILVSEIVAHQESELFRFEPCGEKLFHGFSESHQLFKLIGNADPTPLSRTPFFGRSRETALLYAWWREAMEGNERIVVIRGPAGQGKTRLASELMQWVEMQGGLARHVQCSLEHQHEPLGALLAGLGKGRDSNLKDANSKTAVFESLVAQLTKDTVQAPLLLVVDDLHWADLATRELLDLLIRRLESKRMLLVVTTRPEVSFDYPPSITEIIDLPPLEMDDALSMIAAYDRKNVLSIAERERLSDACGGIPLFIERQVRGRLEGKHHHLSITELLQGELDSLGSDKRILHAAAVLGARFERRHLEALLPDTDIARALAKAANQNLISLSSASTCSFRHGLIRDAAYENLTSSRRKLLHERTARLFIDEPASSSEEIAWHFSAAGCRQEAMEWWLKAGDHAMEREFASAAMESYQQALEQATAIDVDTSFLRSIRMRLGYAAHVAEGYGSPLTYRLFADMAAEIEAHPNHDRGQLFSALAGCYMGGSCLAKEEGLLIAERLHGLASTDAELLMAFYALGNTHFWLGNFEPALAWQEKCIALAKIVPFKERIRYGVDDPIVTSHAFSGWTLWFLGEEEKACAIAIEAITLARKGKRAHGLCFALVFAACLHYFRRDITNVATFAGEALALAKEYKFPLWEGGAGLLLLWAQAASGSMTNASALFDAAAMLQQALPSRLTTSRWIAVQALMELNEWNEAEKLLDIALREAEGLEEQYCVADLLRQKSDCLERRSQSASADDFRRMALALAQQQRAIGLIRRFR